MSELVYLVNLNEVNRYFSEKADTYNSKSTQGFWKIIRIQEKNAILKKLELSENLSVLDLGCGAGYYSTILKSYKVKVKAIDKCLKMVEAARKIDVNADHLELADIEGSKFDRILIAGVLEFSKDPEALLTQAKKMVHPGGKIVVLRPMTGLRGVFYTWFHRNFQCSVHSSYRISKLFEDAEWKNAKAGLFSICSVWSNHE